MPSAMPFDGAAVCVWSPCRRYRYWLRRDLRDLHTKRGPAVFVLHNPSTADEYRDDATVARCVRYARAWGCCSLIVVNRYAIRGTDPAVVIKEQDPVGPLNDTAISFAAKNAADNGGIVIAAWGSFGGKPVHTAAMRARAGRVAQLVADAGATIHALALTADGQPRHPLYLRSNLEPFVWNGMVAA